MPNEFQFHNGSLNIQQENLFEPECIHLGVIFLAPELNHKITLELCFYYKKKAAPISSDTGAAKTVGDSSLSNEKKRSLMRIAFYYSTSKFK